MMLRPVRAALLALTAALLVGAVPGRYSARTVPAGEVPSVGVLQFMAGAWETDPGKDKSGPVTEEVWTSPRAGTMLGVNRVTKDDRTVFWEQLRVEERAGDGLYYVAAPMGKGATAFRLSRLGANFAEFSNPEHEWPQTISYGLTDIEGQLTAVVSGTVKGETRTETWTYLSRPPT
jgi:hypothetical protein